MLRGTGVGTFDARHVPRAYTKEKFMEIYPHRRDPTVKLTMAEEEELACRQTEELRQRSLAESQAGRWGTSDTGGWGAATGDIAGGWGAASGGETSGWATPGKGWGASREDQRGEQEVEAEALVVPLGRPPRRPTLALPPPDILPHRDPWDTINEGNEPSNPRCTIYRPDPKPHEPTFVPGTISGNNISYSVIRDREFLALMLTTANGDEEEEEAVDAAAVEATPVPEEDPEAVHARCMRTFGFRADDALWHQRFGHPSRVTLKNCIEADPFSLLEPRTNRYPKLYKVYNDFLNVGHCGINEKLYTLTFVNAGTCYVWIVNVEACSRAYEVFRLWLAHAQRQSGESLKIWQSDGAVEFRSKELQDYRTQNGIEHHISLPHAHQQQGVAERTNRSLMTNVLALMKQSKLPPI
ncbi:unnamed protein product [Closterium sp. NIES-54]